MSSQKQETRPASDLRTGGLAGQETEKPLTGATIILTTIADAYLDPHPVISITERWSIAIPAAAIVSPPQNRGRREIKLVFPGR